MSSLRLVNKVNTEEVCQDDLTKDEIKVLKKRWSDYLKNLKAVQTWSEVKDEITRKHIR